MIDQNKVLIRCVDCKHWPNSCGYWGSRYKKHICSGFQDCGEMNIKETIYALGQIDIKKAHCNSQVINRAIYFLEGGH